LICLLLSRRFQSSGHQATHGGYSDIFHLSEIDIQPWSLFAPVLFDDNFSPALRQVMDSHEFFIRQLPCGHVVSSQQVPSISPNELYQRAAWRQFPAAK
jgi:hypothetical protein